jgi:hypothetical protein
VVAPSVIRFVSLQSLRDGISLFACVCSSCVLLEGFDSRCEALSQRLA